MEKISPPVRIFAILIVLVGVAGVLTLRTMGPSVEESAAISVPAKQNQPRSAPQPAKAAASASTPQAPTAAPMRTKPVLNTVVPPTGFPLVVDKALRRHRVLVVSLVVPGARVDELAAAEAESGARLGGAGFLALNVLNEAVARSLLEKLDGLGDPSVLVLKRSGEVALELDGFVDRETVAQAVANASA